MAAHWLYRPDDSLEVEAGAAARRAAGMRRFRSDAGFGLWPEDAALPVPAPACATFTVDAEACDVAGAGGRVVVRRGDLALTAAGGGLAGRAAGPEPPDRRRDRAGYARVQALAQLSHRLEPFVEAGTLWRGDGRAEASRRRLVAGTRLPELGLFHAALFAGADAPSHGPAAPAAGAELWWSPRRTLTVGVRAETGSASASLACFSGETGLCVSGRMQRLAASARWRPSDALGLDVGVELARAVWRPGETGARRRDNALGAAARVFWTFAPGWRAELDVAGARLSGSGRRRDRRFTGALSLMREI